MADQSPSRTRIKRAALQWPVIGFLTAVWVLLWGELSVANVLAGFVVAVLVIVVFPFPPIEFSGRPRPLGLLQLVGRFHRDLFVASIDVARQALRIGTTPANVIIRVDLRTRSDFYLALTTELLSLIPGSVVVEADRSTWTLYLHVLGATTDAEIAAARQNALDQEERLVRALASDAELAAFMNAKLEGQQS